MDAQKIRELIDAIEYIDLGAIFDGIINELTPAYYTDFKFCPACGYKEPDGHWRDCEIAELLELLKA